VVATIPLPFGTLRGEGHPPVLTIPADAARVRLTTSFSAEPGAMSYEAVIRTARGSTAYRSAAAASFEVPAAILGAGRCEIEIYAILPQERKLIGAGDFECR
jgi:hypothetical protein